MASPLAEHATYERKPKVCINYSQGWPIYHSYSQKKRLLLSVQRREEGKSL